MKYVERDRTSHLLCLNWTADFSWRSFSNTILWLFSKSQKLCCDWLIKRSILTLTLQMDKQTTLRLEELLTFAAKNVKKESLEMNLPRILFENKKYKIPFNWTRTLLHSSELCFVIQDIIQGQFTSGTTVGSDGWQALTGGGRHSVISHCVNLYTWVNGSSKRFWGGFSSPVRIRERCTGAWGVDQGAAPGAGEIVCN